MISCDKDERYEEYSVNWNARSWKKYNWCNTCKRVRLSVCRCRPSDSEAGKEIISEEGIEGFIAIENQVNASIEANRTVIATGGSVVYGREAMEHLGEIATVIYLKLSYKALRKRLGNLKNRGVVLRDGQTLKDLYEERVVLYEKYADITIDEENKNLEETLQSIVDSLELDSEDAE